MTRRGQNGRKSRGERNRKRIREADEKKVDNRRERGETIRKSGMWTLQ